MPRQSGFGALVGMGTVNGLLLGAGLASAHRGHALFFAIALGTLINLTFLLGCHAAAKQ